MVILFNSCPFNQQLQFWFRISWSERASSGKFGLKSHYYFVNESSIFAIMLDYFSEEVSK